MKMKILMIVMLVSLVVFCVFGCSSKKPSIALKSVYNGEVIDLCEKPVREYLEADTESEQADILYHNQQNTLIHQAAVFSWEGDGSSKYTLYIADNEQFENAYTYETNMTSIAKIGVLIPGTTYYWKVMGDTEGSTSAVDTFCTKDAPVRFITTTSIINVRDIGGWETESGKKVNYELLYRGGKTNPNDGNECAESDAILFRETLGIRTELDLRTANADDGGQTKSVFGDDVRYVKASASQYFYQPVPNVKEIFEVLGDEANYPILFHCNAGADRTGTVAFLVNGVLGVSYEDLTRDFELTSFSEAGKRWRSNIVNGTFTEDGIMQQDEINYVAWQKMYQMIMENYKTEDGTLSSAIENFLVTACKVEQKDIDNLRKIMLQ